MDKSSHGPQRSSALTSISLVPGFYVVNKLQRYRTYIVISIASRINYNFLS